MRRPPTEARRRVSGEVREKEDSLARYRGTESKPPRPRTQLESLVDLDEDEQPRSGELLESASRWPCGLTDLS